MFKVCLDYGHGTNPNGGGDPGAVDGLSVAEKDNVTTKESHMTLLIGKKVAAKLRLIKDIQVVETRTTETFVSLDARCRIADNSKCDILVSIHLDSSKPQAHGITSFCYKFGGKGEKLAKMIHHRLIRITGLTDRGVKEENFQVLRVPMAPAVLLELGFISNPREEETIHTTTFQDKVAQEIVDGILEYKNEVIK